MRFYQNSSDDKGSIVHVKKFVYRYNFCHVGIANKFSSVDLNDFVHFVFSCTAVLVRCTLHILLRHSEMFDSLITISEVPTLFGFVRVFNECKVPRCIDVPAVCSRIQKIYN